MNILECLLYGLVSGLTEFLPISSQAHQAFLLKMFGFSEQNPMLNFLVHLAIIFALLFSSNTMLQRVRRDVKLSTHSRAHHVHQAGYRSVMDMRIVKTAMIPMILGLFFTAAVRPMQFDFPLLSLFLVLNGLILFIPQYMLQGNKDSRSMSKFDAILMGVGGAASVLPGLSRIGIFTSVASIRGASRQHAFNWAILLSIPALIVLCLFDLVAVFGMGNAIPISFLGYIFGVIGAVIGGCVSILLIRFMTVKVGLSGFAYYSWGAALFSFILYLMVV